MSSPTPSNDPPSPRDKRSRLINVYDAIVGRVTAYGHPLYIPRSPTRATQHTSVLAEAILTPDEVLFRRNGAPIRFAEDDMYCAYEDLPDGALPSSDLLKSIHCYASRYYEAMNIRLGGGEEPVDERSMDETALLAFGILLEEAAREALGKDGDLVFTEGEGDLGDSAGGRKRQRTARYLGVGVKKGKGKGKGKGKEVVAEDTEGATEGVETEAVETEAVETEAGTEAVETEAGTEAVDTDYSAREKARPSKRTKRNKRVNYDVKAKFRELL